MHDRRPVQYFIVKFIDMNRVPSVTNEHISHVNFDCDIIVNDDV